MTKELTQEKPRLGEGIFTPLDIAVILGVNRSRVDYLLKSYFRDRLPGNLGYSYNLYDDGMAVNFKGLIEIKIFDMLRKSGFPLKRILAAHDHISKKYNTKYPLANKNLRFIDGDIIDWVSSEDHEKADGSKLRYFIEITEPFLKSIDYDADSGNPLRLNPPGYEHVVIDPAIQFGQPTVRGTRVTAHNLAGMNRAGDSVEDLSYLYDIPPAKVQQAISYWNRAAA